MHTVALDTTVALVTSATCTITIIALLRTQYWYLRRSRSPLPPRTSLREHSADHAEDRALLFRVLDPQQRADWLTKGYFTVRTASGRLYRVHSGATFNITEVNARGTPCATFCLRTRHYTPLPSLLAAQTLLLTTDEAAFRRIANQSHPVHPPRRV